MCHPQNADWPDWANHSSSFRGTNLNQKRYSQYSVERIFLKVGNIDISLALFYFLVQECTKNASLGRSILLIVVIIIILFKRVHVFLSSPYHFSSHLWLELPIKKRLISFHLVRNACNWVEIVITIVSQSDTSQSMLFRGKAVNHSTNTLGSGRLDLTKLTKDELHEVVVECRNEKHVCMGKVGLLFKL